MKTNEKALTYKLPYTSIVGGMFPMARVNSRYVRRSWGLYALQGQSKPDEAIASNEKPYGDKFEYTEFMVSSTWIGGLFSSLSFILGISLLFIPPIRAFAQRFLLNKPGQGPREE